MINECLVIHMIHLVESSELFVLYISGASHGMVRTVNPLNSRILPYDKHCFKFLNLSSWTRSFNQNKSHLNVHIFVLFFVSFVLVLL